VLGIVYSKSTGKQQFIQGVHTDDVIGLAAHPSSQIFATGETGLIPKVIVWNAENMQTSATIVGVHRRGVPLLAFNDRGNLLASVGLDKQHTLLVHDWASGVQVLSSPTDRQTIYCVCFISTPRSIISNPSAADNQDVVVTGGRKHLKFWKAQGQNVQSQRALWGKVRRHTIMCVASSTPDICVTGSTAGHLLIWQKCRVVVLVEETFVNERESQSYDPCINPDMLPYPHKDAIQAM